MPLSDSTRFQANFETDFLTNVTNKTNLNGYLAREFLKLHGYDNQHNNDTVISKYNNAPTENLITVCTSEEADSRFIRRAINLGVNNYKEVSIKQLTAMLLYYPLVMLTLQKMLVLRLFLWYMDQKRHILMCLIV